MSCIQAVWEMNTMSGSFCASATVRMMLETLFF